MSNEESKPPQQGNVDNKEVTPKITFHFKNLEYNKMIIHAESRFYLESNQIVDLLNVKVVQKLKNPAVRVAISAEDLQSAGPSSTVSYKSVVVITRSADGTALPADYKIFKMHLTGNHFVYHNTLHNPLYISIIAKFAISELDGSYRTNMAAPIALTNILTPGEFISEIGKLPVPDFIFGVTKSLNNENKWIHVDFVYKKWYKLFSVVGNYSYNGDYQFSIKSEPNKIEKNNSLDVAVFKIPIKSTADENLAISEILDQQTEKQQINEKIIAIKNSVEAGLLSNGQNNTEGTNQLKPIEREMNEIINLCLPEEPADNLPDSSQNEPHRPGRDNAQPGNSRRLNAEVSHDQLDVYYTGPGIITTIQFSEPPLEFAKAECDAFLKKYYEDQDKKANKRKHDDSAHDDENKKSSK